MIFRIGEGTRQCVMPLEPREARRLARLLLMLADRTDDMTKKWDAQYDKQKQ